MLRSEEELVFVPVATNNCYTNRVVGAVCFIQNSLCNVSRILTVQILLLDDSDADVCS